MFQPRLEITRVPATEAAARAFVAEIDLTIDELQNNLHLMQTVRRATASAFGIDRRDDAGRMAQLADAAKRSEYEGDGEAGAPPDRSATGRLVPRGSGKAA